MHYTAPPEEQCQPPPDLVTSNIIRLSMPRAYVRPSPIVPALFYTFHQAEINLLSNYIYWGTVCGAQLSWREELCSWQLFSLDWFYVILRLSLPQTWSASWDGELEWTSSSPFCLLPNLSKVLVKERPNVCKDKMDSSFPYRHVCSMSTSRCTLNIRLQQSAQKRTSTWTSLPKCTTFSFAGVSTTQIKSTSCLSFTGVKIMSSFLTSWFMRRECHVAAMQCMPCNRSIYTNHRV